MLSLGKGSNLPRKYMRIHVSLEKGSNLPRNSWEPVWPQEREHPLIAHARLPLTWRRQANFALKAKLLKRARRRGYFRSEASPEASLLTEGEAPPRGEPILKAHARLALTGCWQENFVLKRGCLKKPRGEAPPRGEPISAQR